MMTDYQVLGLKWKSYSKAGLFDPGAVRTRNEAPEIIQSLINEMAGAYYDFSVVVNEYESSPWYTDSLQKMREIEKMTQRYIKIRKSYE